jgi:hypothetical protein
MLTPCRRKVAEREVRLARAKWVGPNRIRLRFDPFAYRYIRLKVLERDNYVCYWCGSAGDTMDHVIPWSKGGRTTLDNCICACQDCNGQRGDMPSEEFARLRNVAPPRPVAPPPRREAALPLPRPVASRVPVAQEVVALQPARVLQAVPARQPTAKAMVALARPYALLDLLDPYARPMSLWALR